VNERIIRLSFYKFYKANPLQFLSKICDIYDNWREQFRAQYTATVCAKRLFEIAANNSNKVILFRQRSRLGHPYGYYYFSHPPISFARGGRYLGNSEGLFACITKPRGVRQVGKKSTIFLSERPFGRMRWHFLGNAYLPVFGKYALSREQRCFAASQSAISREQKKKRIFYSSLDITFKVPARRIGISNFEIYSDKYISIREINTYQRNPLRLSITLASWRLRACALMT